MVVCDENTFDSEDFFEFSTQNQKKIHESIKFPGVL